MIEHNKTALVTGATGFLGGALARHLANNGVRVKALARSPQKGAFLRDHDCIQIVEGDITDSARMQAVTPDCDYVFHVAAALGGPLDTQRKVNVDGTRNVMQAAAQAEVARVVHVSSIAVYGYRYPGDITENMPPNPSAEPYSITKAQAETVVHEEAAKVDLAYSIVRPGLIYGPRSNAWTKTLFRLAHLKPTPFFGDGSGSTHPIYVDDLVELMCLLATHPAAEGEIFNAAADPAPTWREFLGYYSRLAGHQRWLAIPPSVSYAIAGMGAFLAPSQSQRAALPDLAHFLQKRFSYKMTKARDTLDWQPKTDLETGIQQCVPWLREQGLLT